VEIGRLKGRIGTRERGAERVQTTAASGPVVRIHDRIGTCGYIGAYFDTSSTAHILLYPELSVSFYASGQGAGAYGIILHAQDDQHRDAERAAVRDRVNAASS
jgi:hypothetical protein